MKLQFNQMLSAAFFLVVVTQATYIISNYINSINCILHTDLLIETTQFPLVCHDKL